MNPNFHSPCIYSDLILNQNFLILSLYYVLIWIVWKAFSSIYPGWSSNSSVFPKTDQNLCSLSKFRMPVQTSTDLSDEWIFLNCVHHTLLSKLCCLFYIVGSLLYFHVSCNDISSIFFSARFGCYIECEQIILWYEEDQWFKTEPVTDYKWNFSCEPCILRRKRHVLMFRDNSNLHLTASPKFTKLTSVLQSNNRSCFSNYSLLFKYV